MDELEDYGSFNTQYEGVGKLVYLGSDPVNVFFEARQLFDGRLLVACVSAEEPIKDNPIAINGHLLSGEPFSTMWGRGITEIYRSEGSIYKGHYIANMMRVRYTKDSQPDDHAIQFALHNFIPGTETDVSENCIDLQLQGHNLTISPVGNYGKQSKRLLRYGGNLRTVWVKGQLADIQEKDKVSKASINDIVMDMLTPISLAIGTLVTCPQMITFDSTGNRNEVEHYTSHSIPFTKFILTQGWDTPVKETVEAWFSNQRPQLLSPKDLTACIRQHLDSCSTEMYLETRALTAATLLDVLAGCYTKVWSPNVEPHKITFRKKLTRLMSDLDIKIDNKLLTSIIKARNSLVHSGNFVLSENDKTYPEFLGLILLGRCLLLRLIGYLSMLHEAI